MKKNLIFNTISLFFAFWMSQDIYSFSFFNNNSKRHSLVKRNLSQMSGSIPAGIDQIINQLNNLPLYEDIKNNFQNKLLLYGPPGNGKTTLAKIIAQETNSHFIEVASSGIVSSYVGSGPMELDKIFKDALMESSNRYQRVVILFDEVDTFAGNNFIDNTNQYLVTVKHFWLWLDRLKNNPNIFVIVATNKFKNLSPAFASRFKSIEISNPNKNMRREVVEYLIKKINNNFDTNFKLNKHVINRIVQTDQLSIRSIEDIVYSLQQNSPCGLTELINQEKNKPIDEPDPNEDKKSLEIFQKYNAIYNTTLATASLIFTYLTYQNNLSNYSFSIGNKS